MDTVAIVAIVGMVVLGVVAIISGRAFKAKLNRGKENPTVDLEIGQGPPQEHT